MISEYRRSLSDGDNSAVEASSRAVVSTVVGYQSANNFMTRALTVYASVNCRGLFTRFPPDSTSILPSPPLPPFAILLLALRYLPCDSPHESSFNDECRNRKSIIDKSIKTNRKPIAVSIKYVDKCMCNKSFLLREVYKFFIFIWILCSDEVS